MLKTFEVKLDVEKELYSPSEILFSVSRNDFESIQIEFEIIQDGNPVDLTDKTVELAILKPSGLAVYQDVTITSALEGKGTAKLSIQAYVEFGIHIAELNIRDAETMVVTGSFTYKSKEGILGTEEIESTNDWGAIQKALFLYDLKPILSEGAPTEVPEYVGQTALDTLNKILYIANDTTAESWVAIIQTDGGTGTVSWETILNKPLTFPSDPHTHEIIDVNGLQIALDGKVDEGTPIGAHTHPIAEIDGLQLALDGKADDGDLAGKSDVGHTHDFTTEITGKPLSYPPDVHSHPIAEVDGLQLALDGKVDDAELDGKADAVHTHNFVDIANKPLTYPPDVHTHGFAEITDKPLTYPPEDHTHDFTTEITGKPATYPPDAHGHAIADVTNLQTTLDGLDRKPLTGTTAPTTVVPEYIGQMYLNTTTSDAYISNGTTSGAFVLINQDQDVEWTEITGKPATFPPDVHSHDFVDITNRPLTYPPDAHSHGWTEITEKPTTFTPENHTHTSAEITDFATGVAGAIPPEYLTETEGDARYQASGVVPAHGHTETDITFNGINARTYVDNGDNYIMNERMNGLSLWKGTQAEYDAIPTKDASTLYFIV